MDIINLDPVLDNWGLLILVTLGFTSGRYLLLPGIAWLLCYYPGLKRLKKYKIQPSMPAKKQMKHELLYSCSTILIFSMVGIAVFLLYTRGYTTIYTNMSPHGWGYFFLTLVIMIILHDSYFYWTHRLLHTRWLFKKIHRVHHRSANPTPLAAYSFHPLEALLESLIVFPFITIWPVHLFAFLLFTFLVLLMNVIGHLGFEFIPDQVRNSLPGQYLTSATHHNLHHQKSNKNFGYYFTFWDKLMKTLQNEIARAGSRHNHSIKKS